MKENRQKELEKKYQFQTEYVKDINNLKKEIFEKKN